MKPELIKCEDCKCHIKGKCFRFPPVPKFLARQWGVKRPDIRYDGGGCFAGIPKE